MNKQQIFEELKNKEEMNPDSYDGSYELMKEVIASYSKLSTFDDCTFKDLNAIYGMTIGTWKLKVDKKKEYISDGCLSDNEKKRLCTIIDGVWDKVCYKKYENGFIDNKPSIGMFGTGFYSFEGKTEDSDVRAFINMLVDISQMDDDEEIFSRVSLVLDKPFKGVQSASASVILHCLKPMTFPIINNNDGNGTKIYDALGIRLDNPKESTTYIKNCRAIKQYRDEHFSFKNYRILDLAARKVDDADIAQGDDQKMDKGLFDHNTILYGPPGTGKSYNSVNYAVAICKGETLEQTQKRPYSEVLAEFNELKKKGRITFTTFHQSYGYEEFIEGIKPITDENGNISYEVTDGLFKDFCQRAELPDDVDINYNANIFIVRLKGNGENDLKSACFRDGVIRFDWPKDYEDGWKKWLDMMNPGDYVLSYYGNSCNVDGIGVVDDEEPFYDETKDSYRWTRKVNWIVTGKIINILEANNGKYLSNFHVGRIPDMKLSSLLKLIKGETYVEQQLEPCVFIIDEINRGNISKIFGELITLIEDTKRKGAAEEMKAVLPYSHSEFSVPNNVYILGTMNTADRSIAIMDTALRRRFSFVEMMPEAEVLKSLGVGTITDGPDELDVAGMLDIINKRIEYLYDREHTIGHAFFTKLKDNPSIDTLAMIFKKNVIPLLQEYFYEDYAKIQYVLGDNQKDPSLKFIIDETLEATDIFNGRPDIDLPERKYRIQEDAFYDIRSYKAIGKGL